MPHFLRHSVDRVLEQLKLDEHSSTVVAHVLGTDYDGATTQSGVRRFAAAEPGHRDRQ